MLKKIAKILGCMIGFSAIVLLVYVVYLFVTYDRIEDKQLQSIGVPQEGIKAETAGVPLEKALSVYSYNIGFGAYTPEFTFFMDGGTESRAANKESVINAVTGAADAIAGREPDFAMFQEVDTDSDRAHHVDENKILGDRMPEYYEVFAFNFHSAYLFYPFFKPHGKSESGLALFSRYPIASSLRRSFPISMGLSKFVDLDRCYTVSRLPVENSDKELVLINLHMTAYGNSDEIRDGQVQMLVEEMQAEIDAGNYIICGGDFNHNLRADEDDKEKPAEWAYPFPRSRLPQEVCFAMDLLPEGEREALGATNRDTSIPYTGGEEGTLLLDGFIISDNIQMISYTNLSTGFLYSDHEPVEMIFQLKE